MSNELETKETKFDTDMIMKAVLLRKVNMLIFKTSNSTVNRMASHPVVKDSESNSKVTPITLLSKFLTAITGVEADLPNDDIETIIGFFKDNNLTLDFIEGTYVDFFREQILVKEDGVIVDESDLVMNDYHSAMTAGMVESISKLLDVGSATVKNIFERYNAKNVVVPYRTSESFFDVKFIDRVNFLESDLFASILSNFDHNRKYSNVIDKEKIAPYLNSEDILPFLQSGHGDIDQLVFELVESGKLNRADVFDAISSGIGKSELDIFQGTPCAWDKSEVLSYFYEPLVNILFYNNLFMDTEKLTDMKKELRIVRSFWVKVLLYRIKRLDTVIAEGKLVFKEISDISINEIIDTKDLDSPAKRLVVITDNIMKLPTNSDVSVDTIKGNILTKGNVDNILITNIESTCESDNLAWKTYLDKYTNNNINTNITLVKDRLIEISCDECVNLSKAGIIEPTSTRALTNEVIKHIEGLSKEINYSLLDVCVDIVYGVMYGKPFLADTIKLNFDETLEIDLNLVKDIVNKYLIEVSKPIFVIK